MNKRLWVAAAVLVQCFSVSMYSNRWQTKIKDLWLEYFVAPDAYQVLVSEQALALGLAEVRAEGQKGVRDVYRGMFCDARAFAPELLLRPGLAEFIDKERLQRLVACFERGGSGASAAKVEDLFRAFAGSWQGTWSQGEADSSWVHEWYPPRVEAKTRGMLCQKVVIRGSGDTSGAYTAINSVCRQTGTILGAVGVRNGLAQRPHVGYLLGPRTLVWVALEGTGEGVRHYSVFVEWLEDGAYHINGFEFEWREREQRVGELNLKWGRYHRAAQI